MLVILLIPGTLLWTVYSKAENAYMKTAKECIDNLIRYGKDNYGLIKTPLMVSILDVRDGYCPANPENFDEYFRVMRRERRNPAGSDLYADQDLLKTMFLLSNILNCEKYKKCAEEYIGYYLNNLIDEHGFIWWGEHRHYDVFADVRAGHLGSFHEIHATNDIDWENLYRINPVAIEREIEAIWQWHVIDKKTGEINRHGDGRPGCDFSMSAGAYIEAFSFMYKKTKEAEWLRRAKFIADYYWEKRDRRTNLFPERPNAGQTRFDGSAFVTSITGPYCKSLLLAFEQTGERLFLNQALTYLKAYLKYGFDAKRKKFWGALKLHGEPIKGPRVYAADADSDEGYLAQLPAGDLLLWQPYMLGYEYPLHTAQSFIYAYRVSHDKEMLRGAEFFANWIKKSLPEKEQAEDSWFRAYYLEFGKQGTYADHYGRTILFYTDLYKSTKKKGYIKQARKVANQSIEKLYENGLFRGHPAKPYYEAVDGVGKLLFALLVLELTDSRYPNIGIRPDQVRKSLDRG